MPLFICWFLYITYIIMSVPVVAMAPTAVIGQVTSDLKAAVAVYVAKTPLTLATVGPMLMSLWTDLASYDTLSQSDKVTLLVTVASAAAQAGGIPVAEVEIMSTVITTVMPSILNAMDVIVSDMETEMDTCCMRLGKFFHC
jgi:hypothetical protein